MTIAAMAPPPRPLLPPPPPPPLGTPPSPIPLNSAPLEHPAQFDWSTVLISSMGTFGPPFAIQ